MLIFCFFNITQATETEDNSTVLTEEEQKKIEKKNDELKILNEKAATYEKMLLLKQKQKSLLGSQIGNLNEEISGIKNEIKSNADKIEELNSRIDTLQQDVIKNENLIQIQKKILTNIIRVYQENNDDAMAKMLLNIENFSTMAIKDDHLSQTSDKIVEMTTNLKSIQSQIKNSQNEILNNKNELVETRNKLEEENAHLSSTKNQKNTLLIQTQGDEVKYEGKLSEIEEKRKEIEEEIEIIEGVKSGDVNYDSLPPIKKGYFTYPINPIIITQGYGKTSFSSHYYSGRHNGIDFGTSQKYISVYSVKSGKVIAIGDNGKLAYGKWIAIDHNDGLVTLYGHLSRFSVSKGSKVKEGDKIGVSGNTGYSTGPHLHFSVFAKNTFELKEIGTTSNIPTGGSIDPNRYLK